MKSRTLNFLTVVGALAAFMLLQPTATAQVRLAPTELLPDSRLVEFDYDPNKIYKVLVRPNNTTLLQLEEGEVVAYISCGDKQSFEMTTPKSREFVEIKPHSDATATNALIKTNKRKYLLTLQSTGEAMKWYQRVSWLYGDTAILDITASQSEEMPRTGVREPTAQIVPLATASSSPTQQLDAKNISVAYDIQGQAPFRPLHVVDDGVRTFIRMPERLQELPALFMIDEDEGGIALVNYAVDPPLLVVPRTAKKFLLKLGKAEVTVSKPVSRSWWSTVGER